MAMRPSPPPTPVGRRYIRVFYILRSYIRYIYIIREILYLPDDTTGSCLACCLATEKKMGRSGFFRVDPGGLG